MAFQKLLLTLDGSKQAETALRYVPGFADSQSTIYVLSVISPMLIQDPSTPAMPQVSTVNIPYMLTRVSNPRVHQIGNPTQYRERLEYLQAVADYLCRAGYRAIAEVEPGETVDTIIARAKEGFDLLIMATHGHSGLARVMLGSVAEAVLHRARCPVLLVPARAAA